MYAISGRTLVFVNAIKTLRRLVAYMEELNLNVVGIHAGMQQRQRLKSLEKFKKSGNCMLVVSSTGEIHETK